MDARWRSKVQSPPDLGFGGWWGTESGSDQRVHVGGGPGPGPRAGGCSPSHRRPSTERPLLIGLGASALCDSMCCSPPGSSVHGIFQARIQVGCHFLLQGISPTQKSNLHLLYWPVDSLPLSHLESATSLLASHILDTSYYFITCCTITFVPDIRVINI